MTGELFKTMTGVNLVHVPYRGSGLAMTDMFGGQVQVMFDNMPSVLEYVRTGRLRALAVTTMARSDLLPDMPTVADTVPGYESSTWFGVGVPRKTPAEIVEKLQQRDQRCTRRFNDQGADCRHRRRVACRLA